MAHKYTLGIEEEFQIVDMHSRELVSHMSKIKEDGVIRLKENVKSEMHQAMVEMETGICENIDQARTEITDLRRDLVGAAERQGLRIAAAGTHPFSKWMDQAITSNPRYDEILNEMRDVARSNLIFGLHVHVGIPSQEEGLRIMNIARYFIPHIYALSSNSPFWLGRDTGFKSYRSKVFDKFPRTGIPSYFGSVNEYKDFIELLVHTKCVDNAKKIWWDIRLHPIYPTIEFRVCDMPMRIDETLCLAAIIQCIVAKIHKLHQQNLSFRSYRRLLINENKWRAARYGIEAKLIDFGKEEQVSFHKLMQELLDFIGEVPDELGCRREVNYVYQILEQGSGADRQLKAFEQSQGKFENVVDYIISETKRGI